MAPNLQMACAFGILGNMVSFLVYLSPLPTFYRIWKNKSTQGFQAIPYSVALFSAALYLYYAFLKKKAILLVTINTFGCTIETVYLVIYMIYATKESRAFTTKLLLLFNVLSLGLIIGATYVLVHGSKRVEAVGWICAAFSLCVFAAPLSIMRQVIKTKSVEFMPFSLSFFLTICAVVWFFYGFLIHDYYIAGPNIIGFALGVIQMALYVVYNKKEVEKNSLVPVEAPKLHDGTTSTVFMEVKPLDQTTHENNPENVPIKHELEIVVLDCGRVVVQSKEPSST